MCLIGRMQESIFLMQASYEISGGPFSISCPGLNMVSCSAGEAQAIDLYEVCLRAQQHGAHLPILVRFPEIIRGRLYEIQVEHNIMLTGFSALMYLAYCPTWQHSVCTSC